MARLSAQEAAEKWARRAGQASQDYVQGVERVRQAPGAAAAAKQDKFQAGIQDAITSGRWARRVAAVSLSDWQQATVTKGSARYAGGVQASEQKMATAMQRVIANVDASVASIANMPDTTFEQRMARSQKFATEMHNRSRGATAR